MSTKNCNCKDSAIVEGIFDNVWNTGPSNEDFLSLAGSDAEISPSSIKSYTLTNSNRMEVVLITWGATIVSIKCPDKYGRAEDIVLGFDDLGSYMNPQINQYFGCTLGRCANRIKNGNFSIGDKNYQVSMNENATHHLHGGENGFSRQIWDSCIDGCNVVMSYMSADGEEGYPGAVLATVRFKLSPDNKLEISMRATTTKSTIVNLSHGSMFNLAGHDAGESELMRHRVSLNCDRWTFTDSHDPLPTGAVRGVGGTVMDLRIPRILRDTMGKIPGGEGFDHNFCVVKGLQSGGSFVARALHGESGRILEVYSNQPGVQFYTGARLPSPYVEEGDEQDPEEPDLPIPSNFTSEASFGEIHFHEDFNSEVTRNKIANASGYIPGKKGAKYLKFGAFSIQPQNFPNAINFPHFPCSVLRPGQVYHHDLTYKFGIQLGNYM
ncbi:galactose mutarotase-like [Venturia canescens]|uniref:galactose mutarotase-like n=1 Tax=Venturia canescens TaxID=32260 RepID=UPI001C9BE654|nr:galactose mutarotase-like [Venturia canescens]